MLVIDGVEVVTVIKAAAMFAVGSFDAFLPEDAYDFSLTAAEDNTEVLKFEEVGGM